jgi:hypothetical protein
MTSSLSKNGVSCAYLPVRLEPYGMKNIIRYDKVNMKSTTLTSAQIRAARALLRWSAVDLARESALGITTIRRAELADEKTSMTIANDLAVRRTLEAAGVEFIEENGGGPGVRLKKRQRKDTTT